MRLDRIAGRGGFDSKEALMAELEKLFPGTRYEEVRCSVCGKVICEMFHTGRVIMPVRCPPKAGSARQGCGKWTAQVM